MSSLKTIILKLYPRLRVPPLSLLCAPWQQVTGACLSVSVSVCVCVCVCSCGWWWWGGGQSSVIHGVREGRGARTGGSSASWQPGGWSCLSVCLSWLGDSSVSSLMVADWRSCVSGGWDHLQCWGLCGWDGCCKCPGGRGERHQRSSQLLSLSVEGTCGRTRCRRHTTQWCS